MIILDLFNTHHEKALKEGAVENSLNELSKNTLKSYSGERGTTIHQDQRDADRARDTAADKKKHGNTKAAADWDDEARWLDKRAEKGAKGVAQAAIKIAKKGVAEGLEQKYVWHGSRQPIKMLEPRQSVDTGGAAGSNQNAIYATSDPKVAIAMGLTTPDSDTAMFPNDPQMVLFSGKIRKGENVYLHKLPFYGTDGKPQFVQGAHDREFHTIPGVKGIKPVEIKEVPVNKYLNLIRQATPADLELQKKYMAEGVAEGGPYDLPGKDYDRPGDIPRKQSSGEHNPYPYSPEEDDDYFRKIFRKKREADKAKAQSGSLNELSNKKLGSYKTAAGADATAADKRGDYKRGDKRVKGIINATKKEFANDLKKHGQQGVAEGSSTASDAVEQAILKRIMVSHTDLLRQFGPEKVMQAAEEVAYNVGDVDEIGPSDVSAYVRQVRQILGAE